MDNSQPVRRVAPAESAPTLKTWTILAYSLPHIPSMLLYAPTSILHGIYAKYFGLSLTALAAVVMFSRIFDAVTDPIVGYLSDRHRARTGSRKPFMVAGGLTCVLGGYLLYSPPAQINVLYLAIALVLFDIGWTMLEVPYAAWGGEVGGTSAAKHKVFSYRSAVGYTGLLAFYAIPMLPFFSSTEITPQTLHWSAIAAAAMMIPALYIAMTKVPDGQVVGEIERTTQGRPRLHGMQMFAASLAPFVHNRPLLILTAAYVTALLGAYMWYGLIFTYVDAYLGVGSMFAQMFMLSFAAGIVSAPIWYKLAASLGVRWAWSLAIVLLAASIAYTGLLEPGGTTFYELLLLKGLNTVGFVGLGIMIPSLISDIADYGTWKFGVNRGASYFASYTFGMKTVNALGAALALAIAGAYGFDAGAAEQTSEAIAGMMLSMVWIPIALVLLSLAFVVMLPLNARRHDIIRRRLAAREARSRRQSVHVPKHSSAAQPPEGDSAALADRL